MRGSRALVAATVACTLTVPVLVAAPAHADRRHGQASPASHDRDRGEHRGDDRGRGEDRGRDHSHDHGTVGSPSAHDVVTAVVGVIIAVTRPPQQSAQPATPPQPAAPPKPAAPSKPSTAAPAKPAKPATTAKPSTPTKPTKTTKPSTPTTPSTPTVPSQPSTTPVANPAAKPTGSAVKALTSTSSAGVRAPTTHAATGSPGEESSTPGAVGATALTAPTGSPRASTTSDGAEEVLGSAADPGPLAVSRPIERVSAAARPTTVEPESLTIPWQASWLAALVLALMVFVSASFGAGQSPFGFAGKHRRRRSWRELARPRMPDARDW